VTAFFRLYQGGNDRLAPVTLETRIVDAAGKALLETSEAVEAASFGDARAADHRFRLPLSTFTAGEYLLTFEATLGKAVVRRDVRLQIR
jgi:hypothetical protein